MSSDFELRPAGASSPKDTSKDSGLENLGPYRIDKVLGQGGMGCVYLATDEQLCRTVALKVLRQDFAIDEEAHARFFREARAAAGLKHENIVTIYQVGDDKGTPFLAMEHLEGKSLEEWLRPDRRASLKQTLTIGKQIARGLAAAHAAGVIHRDIKPANIWLESTGRIKILDFGLAYHASETMTKLTHTGALLGTPAYMSPEQARGESVDERSDLFSFGCVLYRMVTGRLPFQAEGIYGVIAAITSEQQLSPKTVNPAIPQGLSDLIDRLLSKSRDERPASADAVLKALKDIESHAESPTEVLLPRSETRSETRAETVLLPNLSAKLSDPSRAKSFSKPLALGLAVLVLAGGAGLWFALNNPKETKPEIVEDDEEQSPKELEDFSSEDFSEDIGATTTEKIPGSIDLLEGVDVSNALRGTWRRTGDGDSVFGFQPREEARVFVLNLHSPKKVPEKYCLKMQVGRGTRSSGGALLISLSSGDVQFSVSIDAEMPERRRLVYTGFNPDLPKRFGRVLYPGVPVDLAFYVTKDELKVTADDKLIFEWSEGFTLRRRVGISPAPFALGGRHPGGFRFSNVILIPDAVYSDEPAKK